MYTQTNVRIHSVYQYKAYLLAIFSFKELGSYEKGREEIEFFHEREFDTMRLSILKPS